MIKKIKRLFSKNKVAVIIYLIGINLFLVASIFFSISLLKLSGIENVFRGIVIVVLFLLFILFLKKGYKYILKKKLGRYLLLIFINLILSIILFLLTYYINVLYGSLDGVTIKDKSLRTGYMISLNSTKKSDIEKIGMIDDKNDVEGYILAKEIIKNNKIRKEVVDYSNYEDMIYDLYNNNIDAIFVQSNYVSYFSNDSLYENISEDTKIVYKYSKLIKNVKSNVSSNKSLKEPFTILLMGVDSTLDEIDTTTAFNGDTLMLITFNPKTLNATIFSIPRDLYVPISCRNNAKNKINSSAVGGIDCVTNTIKNLTGINVDYYSKINFNGVVDLVDALKGIEVDVQKPDLNINHGVNCGGRFCEQNSKRQWGEHTIYLDPGLQTLNGEEALAYARCRGLYLRSDLDRAAHQQQIVLAMVKKLLTLNTLTDFKDILNSVSNNVSTNLTTEQILSSYDILKSMVKNVISSKEPLIVNKTFLEVYDMRIYNERNNTYSSTLGYYQNSLDDIVKSMKVNLGIIKPTIIKEFSFDANISYESSVAGKGLKENVVNKTVESFIGKSVNYALEWGTSNNIQINKKFVTADDPLYNPNISVGLVGGQSVQAGANLGNIKSITIYINGTN